MTAEPDWWSTAAPARPDMTPNPKDPAADWWGNVYDEGAADTFSAEPAPAASAEAAPAQHAPAGGWVWTPGGWQWTGPTPPPPPVSPPQAHEVTKEDPQPKSWRMQGPDLVDAALNPTGWHVNRVKWCIYWASPALLGWGFRLIPTLTGWLYDCGRSESPVGAYALSLVFITAGGLIHWRTRGWWPPLAWAGRAPLSSAAFAALLYAPASLTH